MQFLNPIRRKPPLNAARIDMPQPQWPTEQRQRYPIGWRQRRRLRSDGRTLQAIEQPGTMSAHETLDLGQRGAQRHGYARTPMVDLQSEGAPRRAP